MSQDQRKRKERSGDIIEELIDSRTSPAAQKRQKTAHHSDHQDESIGGYPPEFKVEGSRRGALQLACIAAVCWHLAGGDRRKFWPYWRMTTKERVQAVVTNKCYAAIPKLYLANQKEFSKALQKWLRSQGVKITRRNLKKPDLLRKAIEQGYLDLVLFAKDYKDTGLDERQLDQDRQTGRARITEPADWNCDTVEQDQLHEVRFTDGLAPKPLADRKEAPASPLSPLSVSTSENDSDMDHSSPGHSSGDELEDDRIPCQPQQLLQEFKVPMQVDMSHLSATPTTFQQVLNQLTASWLRASRRTDLGHANLLSSAVTTPFPLVVPSQLSTRNPFDMRALVSSNGMFGPCSATEEPRLNATQGSNTGSSALACGLPISAVNAAENGQVQASAFGPVLAQEKRAGQEQSTSTGAAPSEGLITANGTVVSSNTMMHNSNNSSANSSSWEASTLPLELSLHALPSNFLAPSRSLSLGECGTLGSVSDTFSPSMTTNNSTPVSLSHFNLAPMPLNLVSQPTFTLSSSSWDNTFNTTYVPLQQPQQMAVGKLPQLAAQSNPFEGFEIENASLLN